MQRHEVPTHLNIEDKAFAGLTMRQLMVAIIDLALAYAAMSEVPLPPPMRLGLGAAVLLWTAPFTLWQPAGRSLEDWAFVLLRYVSVPRIVVWRVRAPRLAESGGAGRFEIVLPDQADGERRRRPMPSPEIDLIKRDNPLERVMGELGRATPAEWLREAIAETGAKGSKAWKYTKAIIERWRLHGRTPRARTSSANPPAGQRGGEPHDWPTLPGWCERCIAQEPITEESLAADCSWSAAPRPGRSRSAPCATPSHPAQASSLRQTR